VRSSECARQKGRQLGYRQTPSPSRACKGRGTVEGQGEIGDFADLVMRDGGRADRQENQMP